MKDLRKKGLEDMLARLEAEGKKDGIAYKYFEKQLQQFLNEGAKANGEDSDGR